MSDALLDVRSITRTYANGYGVRDVTFSLGEGEIMGLLGPNGAGKTTTIRVLTTLLRPTTGSFALLGRPHSDPQEIRRLIGVLPESTGYNLTQTGRELLAYHARLHGLDAGDANSVADSLVEEVGLTERADSRVATYSRGMKQRLGIARALVNGPRLVYLDEPTLGLDPSGQQDLLELIRRIARDRRASVILSTHLLSEAEDLCDRVLILNRGKIVAQGTVSEVRNLVAAPRTARLIVPASHTERALQVLKTTHEVLAVISVKGRAGEFIVTFAQDAQAGPLPGTGAFVGLQASGIPVLRFDIEATRLNDAFLQLTKEVTA